MAVRLHGADQATLFVANIDYNARGQRERVEYATSDGTNFTTTYDYDPDTFRLTRLLTVRHRDNRNLQDLNYSYDPVGNITSIRDNAQQTVFFNNAQVEPHNDYTYDALYRLTRAGGREHAAQNNFQRDATEFISIIGIPFPNSPEAMQRYVEEYAYDSVGNILSMRHVGGAVERWTRRYHYADENNRLLATSLPGDGADQFSAPYSYDAHGNMTTMPHLSLIEWDFKDQLQATSRQVVSNGGTPETTYYVYNAAGERVRKVTERQAAAEAAPTRRNERIYMGGFEIYREYNGNGITVTLERETLHVMDDQQRIAQIDTRTQGDDDAPTQSRRFQLSNHLGSAVFEIDEQANAISYEEYHAYGTSAYRAGRSAVEISLKRYRYTAKERDEETGLDYHGARYYACWLGRWTAADPIGSGDGLNIYQYVSDNPIRLIDPSGTSGRPTEQEISNYDRDAEAHNTAVQTWHAENAMFDPGSKNAKANAVRLDKERESLVAREEALWQRWFDLASRRVAADVQDTKAYIQKVNEEGGQEFMNFGRRTIRRIEGAAKMFGGVTGMLAPTGVSQGVGADFFQAGARQLFTGEESKTVMRGGAELISEAAGNSPRVAAVHGDMSETLISAGAAGMEMGIGLARSSPASLLPPTVSGKNFTPAIQRFSYFSENSRIPSSHPAYTARESANEVMGKSASDVTGIPKSQWLHLLARRFGGGEIRSNLVAGTFEANYQMGRIESLVNHLEGLGRRIEYTGTLRGQHLRLRLVSDNKLILNLRLDVRTQIAAPRGGRNIFNKSFGK